MGICFSHPSIRAIPERQKLISQSYISRGMKLNSKSQLDIHDDYTFKRVLGHGQYGTVREGQKRIPDGTSVEKTYAIKSIPKKKMNIMLLRRELDIMSILDHPNIVKLYENYEDELYVHLIMEYCSGGDIAERIIDDGKFSEVEAVIVLEKLLCAVDYLHNHNISHRDLKPENFLYENHSAESEIKIADFGMSVKFGNNLRMKSLAGTPYYLAPEILKGSYTKTCDIWSLGVFLYFILSGTHPFKGFELDEIFHKITAGKLKFEGAEWEGKSDLSKDLITKMLVVDPRKRITIKKAMLHEWFHQKKSENAKPVPFHIFHALKHYKAQNKLWQEALRVIVKSLNSEQISELKKWFTVIDKNNSGSITADELKQAMKLSGYQMVEEEINEIISNSAYLNEGTINYTDFLIATLDKKKLLDEQVLWEAFKYFDVDNDGTISINDLQNALKKTGTDFSRKELRDLMESTEMLKFENMDFEVFKEIMREKKFQNEESSESEGSINQIVRKITLNLNIVQ